MQRNVIITKDGSHSVEVPEMQVMYHSVHGAIKESLHVYIAAGLQHWLTQHGGSTECTIFEMGFGTGLNALLTLIATEKLPQKILYESVEPYPLEAAITSQLNYCDSLQRPDLKPLFQLIHQCEWNKAIAINNNFTLKKANTSLTNFSSGQLFNIIYYDAFAPKAQPELWTESTFRQAFALLAPGGILVTYCSKGSVRRALLAAGFKAEKLPGPPGKREMLRAGKF
jgi:tRNA U34 5-methylaminomethyl-2-thiouridine-forming methyltransferase MnmC